MFQIHVKRTVVFAIIGLLVALGLAMILPRSYASTTEMLVNESSSERGMDPQLEQILATANYRSVSTEAGILRSESVFKQALYNVSQSKGDPRLNSLADDLYEQYIVRRDRGATMVQLVVRAPNPQLAKDIADEIPYVYNDVRRRLGRDAVQAAIQTLEEQVSQARQELAIKEEEYKQFKLKHGFAEVNFKVSDTSSYLAALEKEIDAIEAELSAKQASIGKLQSEISSMPEQINDSTNLVQTETVSRLEALVADLRAERISLLKLYQPTSQRIKDIEENISLAEQQLEEAKKNKFDTRSQNWIPNPIRRVLEQQLAQENVQVRDLQARLRERQGLKGQKEAEIKELPAIQMEAIQLDRDVNVLDNQYRTLKAQAEDLRNQSIAQTAQATILGAATLNPKPVAPDMAKLTVVGFLAGGILGLLFSFLHEALRLPVRTSGQLAELTGLPVAATMPTLPSGRARRNLLGLGDPDYKPSESFRFMAFSLVTPTDPGPKTIMFTGIGGGVGCSSASSQFAVATAKTGVKTLLVDCDFRHPTLTGAMEAKDKSGISDMLGKSMLPAAESVDLVLETEHKNLQFIPAGTDGAQDLTEFPTSLVQGAINGLKDKADVIVIDAPPCDVVSDASRLVPYVDQVCLVVSAKSTSYRSVPIAYEILKRCGAKSIQLILTHASPHDEPFTKSNRYLINQHN